MAAYRLSTALPLGLALAASAAAQLPPYPPTKTENVTDTIHGVAVPDPYRWLENSDSPEVQAWTAAQNAYTRGLLDRFTTQREALAKRFEELYAADSSTAPQIHDKRYFTLKREGLKNQPLIYMRDGGMDKDPKLVLDPNTFSADGTVAIDWWFPSPDGSWLAYGRSDAGSEKSTLYLRDVVSGNNTALRIPNTRACTLAWDKDSGGFLYVRYPQAGSVPAGDENYHREVYYHKFGTDWKDDPKVFGEGRPKEEWHDVATSSDYGYQFLTASLDWSKNDLYVRRFGEAEFRPVAVGLDGQFSADTIGDKLYLLTNFEAPRYRVLVVDAASPGRENWKEVIPQQAGVIKSMTVIGGKLVLTILENAASRLVVFDTEGKQVREVKLPTLGTVDAVTGRHDKPEMYFSFQSFAHPITIFSYDPDSDELKILERMDVKVELDQYETRQVWFNSKDGTRVPMFVIHRRDLKLDGKNPTILYGYGGFDIALNPTFNRGIFPWLDAGGVYTIANLRGGGEFGKDWHLAGRLDKKQNVFDDMIAAAEKLIADRFTSAERLGCYGGSNGGLLIGAMITQRPDLFRAAISAVPLLDMIRYHNFSIARLWIPEYGSAADAAEFKTLWSYSPYHKVKPGTAYPATLFTTAESDSRVDPMHARKMAAAMQAAQSAKDRPILLWVETKAGHGAGKPLKKVIEQQVDNYIFFMWQLGMLNGNS